MTSHWTGLAALAFAVGLGTAHAESVGDDGVRRVPVQFRFAVGPEVGGVALIGLRLRETDSAKTGETTTASWLGLHLEATWRVGDKFQVGFGGALGRVDQGGEQYGLAYRKGGTAWFAALEIPLRFPFGDGSVREHHWSWLPYVSLHPRLGIEGEVEGAGPIVGLEGRLGADLVSPAGPGLGLYVALGDDTLYFVRASVGIELLVE